VSEAALPSSFWEAAAVIVNSGRDGTQDFGTQINTIRDAT
jgi:hypothetical protein